MAEHEFGDVKEAAMQLIQEYSNEFDQMTQDRHSAGEEVYGPLKFLGVDTIQEALEEIVDLSNYARYTFIKLKILQAKVITGDLKDGESDKASTDPTN
jgi:hypothetical protein